MSMPSRALANAIMPLIGQESSAIFLYSLMRQVIAPEGLAEQNEPAKNPHKSEKAILSAWRVQTVELFLDLFLDEIPSLLCVRHDTGRAVLHSRRKRSIGPRAVKEKKGAVAEEA
jgi:hypothetical protein